MEIESDKIKAPVNVVISVSKRRFKAAHERNRIKRLIREVYRLQKPILLYPAVQSRSAALLLAIQYIGKEEMRYMDMWTKMERALALLVNETSLNGSQRV